MAQREQPHSGKQRRGGCAAAHSAALSASEERAVRAELMARQLGAASRSRVTANLWRRFYAVVRSRM